MSDGLTRRDVLTGATAVAASAALPALPIADPETLFMGIDWGKPGGDCTAVCLTWVDEAGIMRVRHLSHEEVFL